MHRRRHRLHHAQALTASAAIVLAGALASPARAEVRKLTADGTVHTIEVQTVGSGKNTGSALRHTRQGTNAVAQATLVPGTEDTTIDRDPAIEIDPTGKLIAVWSRFDGTNYNLFASRFNGTFWSTPTALQKSDGDDFEPQIRVTAHYVHVAWRQSLGGNNAYYRGSYAAATLLPAVGPERVSTEDLWAIPPEGDTSAGQPEPLVTDRFFVGTRFSAVPGEPGRMQLWGVRDEPVPISYRQLFVLPAAVRSILSADAGFIGGRFTLWYVSGTKLYYAIRSGGAWLPTRTIDLTTTVTASDARWLLYDLNVRSSSN